MKHVIDTYDVGTEEHLECIELPVSRRKELFELMGWQKTEDEIYVYDLSEQQLEIIEGWIGRKISSSGHLAQLAGEAD
jgi:hypothetical protein